MKSAVGDFVKKKLIPCIFGDQTVLFMNRTEDRNLYEMDRNFYEVDHNLYEVDHNL